MVGGAAGNIVFLGDTDENIQRVSTIGRAFYSESYTKIKNHSPINVSAASGGSTFESVAVGKIMMYSESGNSIMWWGGQGDDSPYSGHGMPLWGGQHTDLIPVTNFNAIRIMASVSGQIVYSIGFLNAAQDIQLENTSPYQIDIIPPSVVSHYPVSGFSGLQRNESITCKFSEEVTSGSAAISGVFLLSPAHNVSLYRDPSDITQIVMEPNVNLSGGTQYTARVPPGILTDRVGNALVTGVIWRFTTVSGDPPPDTTPPLVSSTTPASGASSISIDSDVTVLFSEQMLSGTINSTNIYISLTSGAAVGDALPATVTLNASDKKTVTINPSDSLTQATTYHINVTTGVQDLASNAMATIDRSRWFSTTTGTLTEIYNVSPSLTNVDLASTEYNGYAERITGAGTLLGSVPKKVELYLYKTGSPTGTITVAVLAGTSSTHSALTQHVIATMDASALGTSNSTLVTFTNTSQSHVMANGERIAVLYSGGNSANFVTVRGTITDAAYTNGNADRLLNGTWSVQTSSSLTHMAGKIHA